MGQAPGAWGKVLDWTGNGRGGKPNCVVPETGGTKVRSFGVPCSGFLIITESPWLIRICKALSYSSCFRNLMSIFRV